MEFLHEKVQAKNKTLEEMLARQDELRAAKGRFSSQTIDVDELPDSNNMVEET